MYCVVIQILIYQKVQEILPYVSKLVLKVSSLYLRVILSTVVLMDSIFGSIRQFVGKPTAQDNFM